MNALDAHEAPPESLRAIFKKYQKLPPAELNNDGGHLDFSKSVQYPGLKQMGQIATEKLSTVFQHFLFPQDVTSCDAAPIYGSEILPGRLTLFSFCQSFLKHAP